MYNGFAVFTLEREISGLDKRKVAIEYQIDEIKKRRHPRDRKYSHSADGYRNLKLPLPKGRTYEAQTRPTSGGRKSRSPRSAGTDGENKGDGEDMKLPPIKGSQQVVDHEEGKLADDNGSSGGTLSDRSTPSPREDQGSDPERKRRRRKHRKRSQHPSDDSNEQTTTAEEVPQTEVEPTKDAAQEDLVHAEENKENESAPQSELPADTTETSDIIPAAVAASNESTPATEQREKKDDNAVRPEGEIKPEESPDNECTPQDDKDKEIGEKLQDLDIIKAEERPENEHTPELNQLTHTEPETKVDDEEIADSGKNTSEDAKQAEPEQDTIQAVTTSQNEDAPVLSEVIEPDEPAKIECQPDVGPKEEHMNDHVDENEKEPDETSKSRRKLKNRSREMLLSDDELDFIRTTSAKADHSSKPLKPEEDDKQQPSSEADKQADEDQNDKGAEESGQIDDNQESLVDRIKDKMDREGKPDGTEESETKENPEQAPVDPVMVKASYSPIEHSPVSSEDNKAGIVIIKKEDDEKDNDENKHEENMNSDGQLQSPSVIVIGKEKENGEKETEFDGDSMDYRQDHDTDGEKLAIMDAIREKFSDDEEDKTVDSETQTELDNKETGVQTENDKKGRLKKSSMSKSDGDLTTKKDGPLKRFFGRMKPGSKPKKSQSEETLPQAIDQDKKDSLEQINEREPSIHQEENIVPAAAETNKDAPERLEGEDQDKDGSKAIIIVKSDKKKDDKKKTAKDDQEKDKKPVKKVEKQNSFSKFWKKPKKSSDKPKKEQGIQADTEQAEDKPVVAVVVNKDETTPSTALETEAIQKEHSIEPVEAENNQEIPSTSDGNADKNLIIVAGRRQKKDNDERDEETKAEEEQPPEHINDVNVVVIKPKKSSKDDTKGDPEQKDKQKKGKKVKKEDSFVKDKTKKTPESKKKDKDEDSKGKPEKKSKDKKRDSKPDKKDKKKTVVIVQKKLEREEKDNDQDVDHQRKDINVDIVKTEQTPVVESSVPNKGDAKDETEEKPDKKKKVQKQNSFSKFINKFRREPSNHRKENDDKNTVEKNKPEEEEEEEKAIMEQLPEKDDKSSAYVVAVPTPSENEPVSLKETEDDKLEKLDSITPDNNQLNFSAGPSIEIERKDTEPSSTELAIDDEEDEEEPNTQAKVLLVKSDVPEAKTEEESPDVDNERGTANVVLVHKPAEEDDEREDTGKPDKSKKGVQKQNSFSKFINKFRKKPKTDKKEDDQKEVPADKPDVKDDVLEDEVEHSPVDGVKETEQNEVEDIIIAPENNLSNFSQPPAMKDEEKEDIPNEEPDGQTKVLAIKKDKPEEKQESVKPEEEIKNDRNKVVVIHGAPPGEERHDDLPEPESEMPQQEKKVKKVEKQNSFSKLWNKVRRGPSVQRDHSKDRKDEPKTEKDEEEKQSEQREPEASDKDQDLKDRDGRLIIVAPAKSDDSDTKQPVDKQVHESPIQAAVVIAKQESKPSLPPSEEVDDGVSVISIGYSEIPEFDENDASVENTFPEERTSAARFSRPDSNVSHYDDGRRSRVKTTTPNVSLEHPYPLGLPLRKKQFYLDGGSVFLNHSAYGAVPRDVLAEEIKCQKDREANPDKWERIRYPQIMRDNTDSLAKFLNTNSENLLLVDSFARTLKRVFAAIELEDEGTILLNDLTSRNVSKVVHSVSDLLQAKVETVQVDYTSLSSAQDLIEVYAEKLKSDDIKVVIIEHVSSVPAIVFPVRELAELCKSHGACCIVAGLHGPGQVQVDLDAAQPDFYIGSLSKWCFTPPGCYFLWWNSSRAASVQALLPVFSKCREDSCITFGTVKSALNFLRRLGGQPRMTEYTRTLLQRGMKELSTAWGTAVLQLPDELSSDFTRCIEIPEIRGLTSDKEGAVSLFKILWYKYKVWAGIFTFQDKLWLRLSIHVYSTPKDIIVLKEAIVELSRFMLVEALALRAAAEKAVNIKHYEYDV